MSVQSEINRISSAVGDAFDAVSAKGGTVPASEVVANLPAAIASIPSGSSARTATGNLTTNSNGVFTVNCGFSADLIEIDLGYNKGISADMYLIITTDEAKNCSALEAGDYMGYYTNDTVATPNGFTGTLHSLSRSSVVGVVKNKTFSYKATKWTA